MHCKVCNEELTDFESTRKDVNTLQFVDMCNECIAVSGVSTHDRFDLATDSDLEFLNLTVASTK